MTRPALADLPRRCDALVIGGGITGAGVYRALAQAGASAVLVERGDYASGTSSGSSKLVHGGLRYLKSGQWRLTLESVREREALLRAAPGLVEPQPFLMPVYRGQRPGRLLLSVGLGLYDRMAALAGSAARSRWMNAAAALGLEPRLRPQGLLGALAYQDAQTDDARLVLQLVLQPATGPALARNYTAVERLLVDAAGRVRGAALRDVQSGETREIESAVVIDATGAAAGVLRPHGAPALRPLRGSHLLFPLARLPVTHAVSWPHPDDRRPVFVYPWQGAALLGTTDLDHPAGAPVRLGAEEAAYLLRALEHQFPGLGLGLDDAIASYAAVRPVVAGGAGKPSDESRESALWSAPGLVGVTGGKLTTFRLTARQALRAGAEQVPALGTAASAVIGLQAPAAGRSFETLVREEQVVHLDDLLLRRTRTGLVAEAGGEDSLPRLRAPCMTGLGWDEGRWNTEVTRYRELWRRDHAPVAA